MVLPPRLHRARAPRPRPGSLAEPSLAEVVLGVAAFVLIAAACLYLVVAAGA